MLGDYSCRALLNLLGYLLPAYQCYKAIELKQNDVIRQWIIYWFVLALFTVAERTLLDVLLFWLPLYYEGKVLFVIYLWHPKTQGALYLYDQLLQPLLGQHEAVIDRRLAESKAWLLDSATAYIRRAAQYMQSKAHIVVAQLHQLNNKEGVLATNSGGLHLSESGASINSAASDSKMFENSDNIKRS